MRVQVHLICTNNNGERKDEHTARVPAVNYTRMLTHLRSTLETYCDAEGSVLVEVLRAPENLWNCDVSSYNKLRGESKVLTQLIKHCRAELAQNREDQCTAVLAVLRRMASTVHMSSKSSRREVEEYRYADLRIYFGLSRNADMRRAGTKVVLLTSEEERRKCTQERLIAAGAIELITHLIEQCDGHYRLPLLVHTLEFAKALLSGGNQRVQV